MKVTICKNLEFCESEREKAEKYIKKMAKKGYEGKVIEATCFGTEHGLYLASFSKTKVIREVEL